MPHGVLFRGKAEATIREKILKQNYVDALIGLPANIFFATSIETCIWILKNVKKDNNVLFIDVSTKYDSDKTKNVIKENHIDEILNLYLKRENIEKYSYLASLEEIKNNNYNLNISKYVSEVVNSKIIDIKQVLKDIKTQEEEKTIRFTN